MQNHSDAEPSRTIPERMFALGEEPVGVRILRALEEDEVEVMRRSPFGKLVDIAEKLTFSGRFGRYIILRQLKVRKKHEAWFLFAGKPIRFSLREFALDTGLNSKKHINEKPYWGELFGTLKEVPVTEKETRIKYAFLALLASVILPTTHTPRISHEHAEKIKDLEGFLAFPWGRLSFELLMSSIKERNEVSLSQNTIALKGFVMALQLVMIEAVPALTEVFHEGGSSGSEGEYAAKEDLPDKERRGKRSISPGHARETDCAGKAAVVSIILVGNEDFNGQSEFGWSDDEGDVTVDNLVNLIEGGFSFTHSCFTGGASKTDVERMREETKSEAELRKTTKQKSNQTCGDVVDAEYIASCVKARVSEDLHRVADDVNRMGTQLKTFGDVFSSFQTTIISNVQDMLDKFRCEIVKNISNPVIVSPGSRRQHVEETVVGNGCNNGNTGAFTISHARPPIINTNIREDNIDPIAGKKVDNDGVNQKKVNDVMCSVFGSHQSTSPQASPPPTESVCCLIIITTTSVFITFLMLSQLQILDQRLVFPKLTFSLGLTQEEPNKGNTSLEVENQESRDTELNKADGVGEPEPEAPCHLFKKSKRQKVVPKALVGDYECDKTFLTRAWEAHVAGNRAGENIDVAAKYSKLIEMLKCPFSFIVNGLKIEGKDLFVLVEKSSHLPPKVVDVLIHQTRSTYNTPTNQNSAIQSVFLDTKFVVKKECFKFPPTLLDTFNAVCPNLEASRFYFPFNCDKKHWVGVCIDATTWVLQVLDCNCSIRNDVMMCKEMGAIAVMFPYLLRQAGKPINVKELKALSIDRPRMVPQIHNPFYSAVTAVLLIQAHAFGGVEVCRCITSNVLDAEVERLAVNIVEANHCII
ncbi:hypothetical protein N665_0388s0010 [Sinapis alba]|nr:hypothetical protein N665_0388s0010 [Sinapis alba]